MARKVEPIDIEINFDSENEEWGFNPEQADCRHLSIEVKGARILEASLGLLPPDDESIEQRYRICPLRLRPNTTPVYKLVERTGIVEFRADLDIDAICNAWDMVEDAAKRRLPFRFKVRVEDLKTKEQEDRFHPARLRINLSKIRWQWQAWLRDAPGQNERADGPWLEDTPIKMEVDGSGTHGFHLKLERQEWLPEGRYKPAESDFTHYLSPDHKADMTVLTLDPLPWDAEQPTRQIETVWWEQPLPPDSEKLAALPVDTTIRVKAWPADSIVERFSNGKIRREPADAPQLAIREIRLLLERARWKVRVVTPNPDAPPAILSGARPWEDGFDVELEFFDDSRQPIRFLENRELRWEIRPGPGGKPAGAIVADGARKTQGDWTTDGSGRVTFKFYPERECALLMAAKQGAAFFAPFDIRLKERGSGGTS